LAGFPVRSTSSRALGSPSGGRSGSGRRRVLEGRGQRRARRAQRVEDLPALLVEERDEEPAVLGDDARGDRVEPAQVAALEERRLRQRLEHHRVGEDLAVDRERKRLGGLQEAALEGLRCSTVWRQIRTPAMSMSGMTASITRATRYDPNVALVRATRPPYVNR
jgi:hypothetical protein